MAFRRKMKLAWIENDAARKTTYIKRKQRLLKKIHELNALSGVTVCAIIDGRPYDPKPIVWPSPEVAKGLVTRFHGVPDMEKHKEEMDVDISYLQEQLAELQEQLQIQEAKQRELEMTRLMYLTLDEGGLEAVRPEQLNDLAFLMHVHEKNLERRIQLLAERAETESAETVGDGSAMLPDGAHGFSGEPNGFNP